MQIVNTIEANSVTVIEGPTGSGKTTQVPQYILDSYRAQNKYCNIAVTQPRRIAAISVAKRVCHDRRWEIGRICGYQVIYLVISKNRSVMLKISVHGWSLT